MIGFTGDPLAITATEFVTAGHAWQAWRRGELDEDPETGAYYTSKSGRPVDADALRLYRLWWDLCEISLYVAEFHSPHIDSVDTRTAWQGLEKYLDPRRWVEAN